MPILDEPYHPPAPKTDFQVELAYLKRCLGAYFVFLYLPSLGFLVYDLFYENELAVNSIWTPSVTSILVQACWMGLGGAFFRRFLLLKSRSVQLWDQQLELFPFRIGSLLYRIAKEIFVFGAVMLWMFVLSLLIFLLLMWILGPNFPYLIVLLYWLSSGLCLLIAYSVLKEVILRFYDKTLNN